MDSWFLLSLRRAVILFLIPRVRLFFFVWVEARIFFLTIIRARIFFSNPPPPLEVKWSLPNGAESFCSSYSTRHDAVSIWAHLLTILDWIQQSYQDATSVHFVSDGPPHNTWTKQIFTLCILFLQVEDSLMSTDISARLDMGRAPQMEWEPRGREGASDGMGSAREGGGSIFSRQPFSRQPFRTWFTSCFRYSPNFVPKHLIDEVIQRLYEAECMAIRTRAHSWTFGSYTRLVISPAVDNCHQSCSRQFSRII